MGRHVVRRLGVRRDLRRHRSYAAASVNGLARNAVNITIVVALLIRARQPLA
jgi:hypothetical protein